MRRERYCSVRFILFILLQTSILLSSSIVFATTQVENYELFSGTQYPLSIYVLTGEAKGPTIFIQGGIQGDEQAGFISAQILSRSKIANGRLIIIPRANIPSIHMLRRQIFVDMNRRFDKDYNKYYEDRLVRGVKFFLKQADALIHLHEGSGFHSPTYVNKLRNPNRYGQSIIIDALEYDKIPLGKVANQALANVNSTIANPNYHFTLFNMKTFQKNSEHAEQTKSMTGYAVNKLGIPAYAVEVSKDIVQLGWKVHQQLKLVKELLTLHGIEIEIPVVTEKEIETYNYQYGKLLVNGQAVKNGSIISVSEGIALNIKSEESTSKLSKEFLPAISIFNSKRTGVNLLTNKSLVLNDLGTLNLYADGKKVASYPVKTKTRIEKKPVYSGAVFLGQINSEGFEVQAGEVVQAVAGDKFFLEGVHGSSFNEILNLKGFVAIPWDNTGQDIGWEIILDPDNFMKRYELGKKNNPVKRYRIVRETETCKRVEFYLDIAPREIYGLRVLNKKKKISYVLPWEADSDLRLPKGDYELQGIWSNGEKDLVVLTTDTKPVAVGQSFSIKDEKLKLTARHKNTFAPIGSIVLRSK